MSWNREGETCKRRLEQLLSQKILKKECDYYIDDRLTDTLLWV